jgi:hypothetical protein
MSHPTPLAAQHECTRHEFAAQRLPRVKTSLQRFALALVALACFFPQLVSGADRPAERTTPSPIDAKIVWVEGQPNLELAIDTPNSADMSPLTIPRRGAKRCRWKKSRT